MDFKKYRTLTFDCYGTIIDWESGIADAISDILARHNIITEPERILTLHAKFEPEIQDNEFLPYREVLKNVVDSFAREFGFIATETDRESLPESITDWPPFPDSHDALIRLQKHYELAVVSNIDDDLFARSQNNVGVDFDYLVTAQQVGAYKPSPEMFAAAFAAIGGPQERILHVAQSLYHDIAPANKLGLDSVWVNRRSDKTGSGATPLSAGLPDLEVTTLGELADLVDQYYSD